MWYKSRFYDKSKDGEINPRGAVYGMNEVAVGSTVMGIVVMDLYTCGNNRSGSPYNHGYPGHNAGSTGMT